MRVISGGQTGVDRATLDAAIALDIPHGGWCPKGRRAEDGRIPAKYNLTETGSSGYMQRTIRNVDDAHANLILFWRQATGGTLQTLGYCQKFRREWYISVDLASPARGRDLHQCVIPWMLARLDAHADSGDSREFTLNVAGPRASKDPLVYPAAYYYVHALLAILARIRPEHFPRVP